LFATLAGSFISVATKGLRAIVDSGQWTVVSGEKKRGWGMRNPSGLLPDKVGAGGTSRGHANERGERAARMLSENHVRG